MKKSLLSLALAGSMLSALAVPAFAATPTDVVGTPSQSAVEELAALGILKGYEDGTFKPNNDITRAELAKIVVIATGNESTASLMNNTAPAFKDVKKSQWYTGYINVAAAKGYIQGYNGNFRPNDNVKFEEVVAILVRALGYKDSKLSGSWPYNVLLQADEVGLFEGVDIAQGTNANRGTVAELTANALDKEIQEYNADGDIFGSGKLFISKLGTFESGKVVTSAALNSNGQLSLGGSAVATSADFFVTGGQKLSELLGHTVGVLKNKQGQVLAVTDSQTTAKIVTASTDAADLIVDAANTFKVNNGGGTYTTTADFKVYDNTDALAAVHVPVSGTVPVAYDKYVIGNDKEVQLLLDKNDKVQAILLTTWDSNVAYKESVSYTTYNRIVGQKGYNVKVDANTAITLNGNAATLADLKENDIINVIQNDAGNALKVVATRTTVTGKVTAIGADKDGNTTYTVNGTVYSQVGGQITALTTSNIGTEYTFSLNKDGQVVYFTTTAAVAAANYAIIYSVDNGNYSIIDNGTVTLPEYTKVVYYSLKDNAKVTAYTKDPAFVNSTTYAAGNATYKATHVTDNFMIPVVLDDSGRLKLTLTGTTPDATTSLAGGAVTAIDSSTLTAGGTNYRVDSNTVYLKYVSAGADNSTVAVASAADVVKTSTVAVKSNDNGVAQYVVIRSAGTVDQLAKAQGLFISRSYTATSTNTADNVYTVNLNVKGETKSFNVTSGVYNSVAAYAANDVVTLTDAPAPTAPATDANYGDGKYDVVVKEGTVANTPAVLDDPLTTGVDESVPADITVTDIGAQKFNYKTAPATYQTFVATANTQVFIKKADGTVTATNFADVLVAADNLGTTSGKYQVKVVGTGTAYNTVNNEAGVILVIVNP